MCDASNNAGASGGSFAGGVLVIHVLTCCFCAADNWSVRRLAGFMSAVISTPA